MNDISKQKVVFECEDEEQLDQLMKAFRPEEDPDSGIYVCDPMKNTRCAKTGCAYFGNGNCYCTLSEDCSVNEESNMRILKIMINRHADCFDHIPKVLLK